MDLCERIRHNLEQEHVWIPGDRVVVAVSGGPDSLCLLHVLLRLRAALRIELHVAHLNHGLRGLESDADAEFVRSTAAGWGIPATIETADVAQYCRSKRLSLEEGAREVRYDFLQRAAGLVGARDIILGHTRDDQVETILMHWLRGAGPAGLRGMLVVQAWLDGLRLVRPMLDITRNEVERYCSEQNLSPRLDRSNEDERIQRNRLRRTILPLLEKSNPNLRANLLRTASILAAEDAFVDAEARLAFATLSIIGQGTVTLALGAWRDKPLALQRRMLRQAWQLVCGSRADVEWIHVENVLGLLGGAPGSTLSLPHGVRVLRGYDSLVLWNSQSAALPAPDLPQLYGGDLALAIPGSTPLPGSGWSADVSVGQSQFDIMEPNKGLAEYFDGDHLEDLCLRRLRPGDRMQPLGMTGTKKVHDILVDARVPRSWRRDLPALVSRQGILWIPGGRRSALALVTAGTTKIVCVAFVRSADAASAQRGPAQ